MGFLLDTTFLIDIEREAKRRSEAPQSPSLSAAYPAHQFLHLNEATTFDISIITAGEFAAGFSEESKKSFSTYLAHFSVLGVDHEIAWLFGQVSQSLRKAGTLIGANDIWIACTALKHDLTLVSRNIKHFTHVAGLACVSY